MLSQRILKLIGFRFHLLRLGGATYFTWDASTQQLKHCSTFTFIHMSFGVLCSHCAPVIHLLFVYLKLNPFDEEDKEDESTLFATLVIAWGEIFISMMLALMNSVVSNKRDEIIFIFNQLVLYSTQLEEFLRSRNIELDRHHKRVMRMGEILVFSCNLLTLVLPFGILACLFHPLEPTHRLVKEWFELEFKFELMNAPVFAGLWLLIYGCSNMIIVLVYLATIYYQTTMLVLDDLTPERLVRRQGVRVKLETKYYGELEDLEIVNMYRAIRMFNVLINDIMASSKIAFHHVACLTTFSALVFFAIKHSNVLIDGGFTAIFIIGSCIISPLAVVGCESFMFALIIDLSDKFIDMGRNLVGRKTVYRKFIRSCQTFYVEEAYPFYHIGKDTFLNFLEEGLDKSITLLLW